MSADSDFDDSLNNSAIADRFRLAGELASQALNAVQALCVEGAQPFDVCVQGDALVEELVGGVMRKNKSMSKGAAFPVSISVNGNLGCYAPVTQPSDEPALATGDVVKIDLGVHVDGCPAVVATTIVVGTPSSELDAETANLMVAAHTALGAAVRAMEVGQSSGRVTEMIQAVAADFGVHVVEGVLSHQMERFVLDGNNVIICKPTAEQQVETFDIAAPCVFALDVVFATSDVRPTESPNSIAIFKRNPMTPESVLKSSTTSAVYEIVRKNAPAFPFSPRSLAGSMGSSKFMFGISQLRELNMIDAYPTIKTAGDTKTAHFKASILITPAGKRSMLTTLPSLPDGITATSSLTSQQVIDLMAKPLVPKKKKNKKKKKKPAAAAE